MIMVMAMHGTAATQCLVLERLGPKSLADSTLCGVRLPCCCGRHNLWQRCCGKGDALPQTPNFGTGFNNVAVYLHVPGIHMQVQSHHSSPLTVASTACTSCAPCILSPQAALAGRAQPGGALYQPLAGSHNTINWTNLARPPPSEIVNPLEMQHEMAPQTITPSLVDRFNLSMVDQQIPDARIHTCHVPSITTHPSLT